jgi:RNA recognition motif-containing protein
MKIYVGNLGTGVSGRDLRAAFGVYGEVTSAEVSTDYSTGASRGFGFVVMRVRAEGEAAITGLDGREPPWQVLLVQEGRSSQRLRQGRTQRRSQWGTSNRKAAPHTSSAIRPNA